MKPPLTVPEIVIGVAPVFLLCSVFWTVRVQPLIGFTESGRRYRRVDSPDVVPVLATRAYWLVFVIVVGSAALWALFEALRDAALVGTVSLPGRRRFPRPVVSWPAAWGYFLGLSLILVALIAPWFTLRQRGGRAIALLLAPLLGSFGWVLWPLSSMLGSVMGILLMLAASITLGAVWWVNRSSGKWAALAVWATAVGGLLVYMFA